MGTEFTFLAELPPGYDNRTRLALTERNQVIATHPEHPALLLGADGQWCALDSRNLRDDKA
jgi:hypothetical protein